MTALKKNFLRHKIFLPPQEICELALLFVWGGADMEQRDRSQTYQEQGRSKCLKIYLDGKKFIVLVQKGG